MNAPTSPPLPAPDPNSARWFSEHVQVHDAALRAYLRHAFPDAHHEVEDVVQESYLRVWRTRAGQPLASARAFLFKVARNVTLDFLRRRHISPVRAVGDLAALPVMEDRPGVAETVAFDEKVRLLAEGIATLPPRGREILMMRKFQNLPQREVAARLGIAEKTADEHLARALRRLGRFLRDRGVSDLC